jgi:hypothetical protein
MDADRLRSKIRKLLALAESGAGPEASSAGDLAARLMAEHDLRAEDLGEAPPFVRLVEGKSWPVWRRALLTFAAQSNESVALFRRGKRQVSEASLRGVRAGVERSLSYYLELVRVTVEVGETIAPLAARLMDLEPFTGPRRAGDSVRKGIVYGLIQLQSKHLWEAVATEDRTSPSSDPSDFGHCHSATVPDPSPAGPRPEDRVLAKIEGQGPEDGRWESMDDPSVLVDVASEDLFDLGCWVAQSLVEVDEAGYMKVVRRKKEVRRDGTDD